MNRYEQVVEKMRALLYAGTQVDRQTVASLAKEYADLCSETNGRLKRVAQFLNRGLRSEAVHQASVAPNVVNVVTMLDFLELPTWLKLTSSLGFPRPPVLLIDVAAELNKEFAAEKALAPLLKNHRLFAVSRAPISARIAVLRQLAERDVKNPIWRQELRKFEVVRFDELRGEFDVCFGQSDLAEAAKLQQELEQTSWSASPPAELVQHVGGRMQVLLGGAAKQKLETVAQSLVLAMNDLDVELVQRMLPQWNQLVHHARPKSGDPSVAAVQRVIAWYDQEKAAQTEREEQAFLEQQIEKQLEDFNAAVKGSARVEELTRQREDLRRRGVPIPDFLEGQFEARIKQHQSRRLLKIAFIVGGTLLVVGAGVAAVVLVNL